MREIKFRAWIKDEQKMCQVEKLWFPLDPFPMRSIELDKVRGFGFDEVELMQYTGLKDKNGKEIYEGDIVKISHGNGYLTFVECVEVTWEEYGFSPMNWQYECDGCSIYCEILEIEVIGNIYENPELLKEE